MWETVSSRPVFGVAFADAQKTLHLRPLWKRILMSNVVQKARGVLHGLVELWPYLAAVLRYISCFTFLCYILLLYLLLLVKFVICFLGNRMTKCGNEKIVILFNL